MSVLNPRRVSYVLLLALPPLTEPRNGRVSPFIIPHSNQDRENDNLSTPEIDPAIDSSNPFFSPEELAPSRPRSTRSKKEPEPTHPRHCLGVSALALDTSTILSGSSSPQGIVYTGGRDGLVASWELGIPHKRRSRARWTGSGGSKKTQRVRWERLEEEEDLGWGGGGNEEDGYIGDGFEEEEESAENELSDTDQESEEEPAGNRSTRRGLLQAADDDADDDLESQGWLQPGQKSTLPPKRRKSLRTSIPYEHRWEIDLPSLSSSVPPPTSFRQSVQTHTDWVNDLVLCNMNQTLLSASSDRTIRAWNPHDRDTEKSGTPGLVGRHADYVKVLSFA